MGHQMTGFKIPESSKAVLLAFAVRRWMSFFALTNERDS
jgi:hypothetical protein